MKTILVTSESPCVIICSIDSLYVIFQRPFQFTIVMNTNWSCNHVLPFRRVTFSFAEMSTYSGYRAHCVEWKTPFNPTKSSTRTQHWWPLQVTPSQHLTDAYLLALNYSWINKSRQQSTECWMNMKMALARHTRWLGNDVNGHHYVIFPSFHGCRVL